MRIDCKVENRQKKVTTPPSHIAQLFHEVFEEPEFKNKYRLISFAILDDHNAHRAHNPEGNYKPFVDEFMSIK